MEHKIFTIFDIKAGTYAHPFMNTTPGLAERQVQRVMSNPDHDFFKYSDDFELYCIGEYDDETADIKMYERKIALGKLTPLKQNRSQNELNS